MLGRQEQALYRFGGKHLMKLLVWILVLLATPSLVGAADSARVQLERTQSLCRGYTEGFVHPALELAYGKRLNGPRGSEVLESVEAVAKRTVHGELRPWGYGSGIEDLAYYSDSSLDQHSLYVCGLWRYYNSPLATAEEKPWIARMIVQVLRRFEKNNWSFLTEDDSAPSHAGGDMLPMRPTPAALLLAEHPGFIRLLNDTALVPAGYQGLIAWNYRRESE